MKKNLMILFLVVNFANASSFAEVGFNRNEKGRDECIKACRYDLNPSEKMKCLRQLSSHSFQASACQACRYYTTPRQKIACIAAIADRVYSREEVSACRYDTTPEEKIECFSVLGHPLD